ncbi:MAG: phosphoribosylanthranilate isomerase [Acidobacteria bacterium]|nr:phosphoribosylanthranilate isomerase [Acidobacteriota bacterium]
MTRVKICGLTREEDALAAALMGADFLGFVFVPSSRRCIDADRAKRIVHYVRGWMKQEHDRRLADARCAPFDPREIRFVGVFANQPRDLVDAVTKYAGLDVIQLHGDESPDEVAAMRLPVIKAFRVGDELSRPVGYGMAHWYLFDAASANGLGGTGTRFDWRLVREISEDKPLFLAGGLTPENVGEAVATVRPFAVDVASGVESEPGIKDHEKIRAFIDNVRSEV